MNKPGAAGFLKAMEIKVERLMEMKAFIVVKNVISLVWASKQKRYPDGSVCKLKAHICACGFELL